MNDHEIGERLIVNSQAAIKRRPNNIRILTYEGNYNAVLMNYGGWGQDHIKIGVVEWRRGEDPRSEFSAGLDAIEQGLTLAQSLSAGPNDIDQLELHIAQPIAYLMNRNLTLPDGYGQREDQLPDVMADELLADALFDRPYRQRLPTILQALAAKKRQMLALLSFQTYFDLLDAAGDPMRIAELAAQGDALYQRRVKDVFYANGSLLSAGGDENSIMVDYQLAAVLKKVGFKGESLHRWRWD